MERLHRTRKKRNGEGILPHHSIVGLDSPNNGEYDHQNEQNDQYGESDQEKAKNKGDQGVDQRRDHPIKDDFAMFVDQGGILFFRSPHYDRQYESCAWKDHARQLTEVQKK